MNIVKKGHRKGVSFSEAQLFPLSDFGERGKRWGTTRTEKERHADSIA